MEYSNQKEKKTTSTSTPKSKKEVATTQNYLEKSRKYLKKHLETMNNLSEGEKKGILNLFDKGCSPK